MKRNTQLLLCEAPKQGSGPEGVDDLCFHTCGEFSPSPPPPGIQPLWLDFDLKLRLWPQGWDLGLQARIWALTLGSESRGDMGEDGENSPHV